MKPDRRPVSRRTQPSLSSSIGKSIMTQLTPKHIATISQSTGKDRPEDTAQPADVHQPTAATVGTVGGGGGGGAGKPPAPDWLELLDPGQPFYGNPCIEDMYRMLFSNPNLYGAYYSPRVIPGLASAAELAGMKSSSMTPPMARPMVKPMDLTLRSAHQAAYSSLVKPHERPLVHLASIVSPCGLLMATHDAEHPDKSETPTWDQIAFIRMYMLSKPLIKIKGVNMEMGNTLAAVLGQGYEQGDVDFDQVTRLATAVRLSDTKLTSYWTDHITTGSNNPLPPRPH